MKYINPIKFGNYYLYTQQTNSEVPTAYFACSNLIETGIEFADTIKNNGIYIFSQTNISPHTQNILKILSQYPKTAFLWLENPTAPYQKYNIHGICAEYQNELITVKRSYGFIFGEYYLNIPKNSEINCHPEKNAFIISKEQISLNCGKRKLKGLNPLISAESEGSINFDTLLKNEAHESGNLFAEINAGIRYAAANLDNDDEAEENGFIDEIYSPILSCTDNINLSLSINPLAIRDKEKSYLKIEAGKNFESSLITVSGNSLTLRSSDDSKLIFQPAPSYIHDGTRLANTLKLGISGSFTVAEKTKILCGLSGTEFLDNEHSYTLTFKSGNGFINAVDTLTNDCETSHIRASAGTIYYSQPQASPFFAINQNRFNFLPMPQYQMENIGADEDKFIPLIPYHNAVLSFFSPEKCDKFESVLSKSRHDIFEIKPQDQALLNDCLNAQPNAVSTQGLFIWVGLTNGPLSNWNAIGFAKTKENYLRFTNISAIMRSMYQESNLFITYDQKNPIPADSVGHDFAVTLEGFKFALHPDNWKTSPSDTATQMIVKYRTDKSIAELSAENIVIKASIASCNDENGNPREEFSTFLKNINDKNFQGVLFLNPKIEIDETKIIPEIKLMMKGIGENINRLFAHHLIFPRNKISSEGASINIEESRFFAIVDYQSSDRLTFRRDIDTAPDADFKTTSFLINIEASVLKDAQSVSELLINSLFGESVTKKSEGGNCLLIDGRLIKQDGQSIFKYSLRSDGIYDLRGKLKHICINSVSLTPDENTEPLFNLSGRLLFDLNKSGDLFCYGFEDEDENDLNYDSEGLLFNNLMIKKEALKYKITYSSLCPDQILSKARDNSMASRFPYFLKGLIFPHDSGGKTPQELGYIAIQSPEPQSVPSALWYGLRWQVPLGSLGDLSGGDTLDIEVLTAWSPESGCLIGVKLPFGVGGLDVQGILKLGFKAIEITAETTQKEETAIINYKIILTQFALSVLSFTFPPGNNKIYIAASEDGKKLGWFAAYADDKEGK